MFKISPEVREHVDIHNPDYQDFLIKLQKYLNKDTSLDFKVEEVVHRYKNEEIYDSYDLECVNEDREEDGLFPLREYDFKTEVTISFVHPKYPEKKSAEKINLGVCLLDVEPSEVLAEFFESNRKDNFVFNNKNSTFKLYFDGEEPILKLTKMFVEVHYK